MKLLGPKGNSYSVLPDIAKFPFTVFVSLGEQGKSLGKFSLGRHESFFLENFISRIYFQTQEILLISVYF